MFSLLNFCIMAVLLNALSTSLVLTLATKEGLAPLDSDPILDGNPVDASAKESTEKNIKNADDPAYSGPLSPLLQRFSFFQGSKKRINPNKKITTRKSNEANSLVANSISKREEGFRYLRPEDWTLDNPECGGRRQSPIDLDSRRMVLLKKLEPLKWTNYSNEPTNITLQNNGHTVELSAQWKDNEVPFISGGPLKGDYVFAQLHFHWGAQDDTGSEHTVNNRSFPLEMHMVHFKRDYGTFSDALRHKDGLAVIALFFRFNEKPNYGLNLLQNGLKNIKSPESLTTLRPFLLTDFYRLGFKTDYALYNGSLTTPPCTEAVTWILSARPLIISHEQVELFRNLQLANNENYNYRPTQPRNGRTMYYVE